MDFYEICLAQQYIAESGIAYAKELWKKEALGGRQGKGCCWKLTASLQVRAEFVRKADASQMLNFIQDEHPQTVPLSCPTYPPARHLPLYHYTPG